MSASIGKWGRTDNEAEGKGWEHDYWQLFGGFQHSTRSRRMSSSRLSRRIMAQRADEEWDHDEWGEGQWEQMEPFEDEERVPFIDSHCMHAFLILPALPPHGL
jgi:hypothetical protein